MCWVKAQDLDNARQCTGTDEDVIAICLNARNAADANENGSSKAEPLPVPSP